MNTLTETYRGEVLAWEADDLGHMNMRFYFQRARQARANLFIKLGIPRLHKAASFATIVPANQHIKYHREVRPGQGLYARSGVVEISETTMKILHVIYCVRASGDAVSATIYETVNHIYLRTGNQFAWPQRTLDAASKYMTPLLEDALPRNINVKAPSRTPSFKSAKALGLETIGLGNFMTNECDAFGNVRPFDMIGRVSDSVQHLRSAWPDLDFADNGGMSGALLEAYMVFYGQPQAGDSYQICSGLRDVSSHVRELGHWMLDPATGEPWFGMIGVACKFDLNKRRLVKTSDAEVASIRAHVIDGFKA